MSNTVNVKFSAETSKATPATESLIPINGAIQFPKVELTTAAIEAEQVSQTVGQQAYDNLIALRTTANKYLSTVIAQGRKAKLELVGKIYAEFFSVKNSNQTDALIAKIEQQLKIEDITYRSNTPAGTKLVRFVFATYNDEDLTSKEAFQYCRAMDVAFDQGKLPTEFEAFVVAKGGFAGIMKAFPVTTVSPSEAGNTVGAVKLEDLRQSPTVSEIEVADWDHDEEFRVYIAVRSDDTDDGLLKVMRGASKQAIEKFIAICEAERKADEKPAKDAAAAKIKLEKLALAADLHRAELDLAQFATEQKRVKNSGDAVAIAKAASAVAVQAAVVAVAKAKVKAISAKKADKAAA